jgi:hypothetical protein
LETAKEGIEGGKTFTDVSINEKDKNGVVAWPTFSQLAVGDTIEADYWRSPTNKEYLFAPKPKGQSGGRTNSAAITKAQETKKENIKEAQENRAQGLKLAAAMRDAKQEAFAA